ncbi:BON domain-containing protein [Pandoraea sp. XY-2]|uniref:BON domain-containing protein n=1 Tax=Pandoraea sp. XY-2 TaxID=2518599 RepID=UPI00101B1FA0|nr:BON domain-containing protein [Pandoraea sp. XY-2]QBC31855.1 BON domain-containing protein [Pandoraea sp. XY-2]
MKLDTENKCMVRVHRPAWRGALTGGLAIALGLALVPAKAEDSSMTSEAKSDMHRSERVMSDSWITTKVKSELLANSISDGTNVSVKTTHGVVVLTGTLASQDAVSGAKRIAEHVKGVKRVDSSGLTVGPR